MSTAKTPVSINGIEFDALIDEERTFEAEVPEYAVEDGFVVSDAIIKAPETLSMTLYLTNTPVTWAEKHGTGSGRVQEVIDKLEQLYFEGKPVTVITSERIYSDMSITTLSLSKNLENGPSREIPISFKKISITSSKTTEIPEWYGKSGKSNVSVGTANTKINSRGSNSPSLIQSRDEQYRIKKENEELQEQYQRYLKANSDKTEQEMAKQIVYDKVFQEGQSIKNIRTPTKLEILEKYTQTNKTWREWQEKPFI